MSEGRLGHLTHQCRQFGGACLVAAGMLLAILLDLVEEGFSRQVHSRPGGEYPDPAYGLRVLAQVPAKLRDGDLYGTYYQPLLKGPH